jgi:hypothetical protein
MAGSTRSGHVPTEHGEVDADLADLVTDPDRFFRSASVGGSYRGPVAISMGMFLLSVVQTYVLNSHATAELSGNTANVLQIVGMVSGAVSGLFTPFLSWIMVAVVVYLVSKPLGGQGSFRDTVRCVGWVLFPYLLGAVLVAATVVVTAQSMTPPTTVEAVGPFYQSVMSAPAVRMAQLVQLAFIAWSGFVLVFAVKHARRMPVRHAALAAAPVVALSAATTVMRLV